MRVTLLGAMTAVLLTACGTTVPQGLGPGPAGLQGGSALGDAVPGSTDPGSALASGSELGGAVSGPLPGGSGGAGSGSVVSPGQGPTGLGAPGSAGTPGQPAVTAPGASGAVPARHRAVSDTTIKVGYVYLANQAAAGAGFGLSLAQGDEPGEIRALVEDINDRGGIAGRQLEVFIRDFGGFDEAALEAACTYFTQDEPVFIVFTSSGHNPIFNECLAKGDVAFTSDSIAPSDAIMRRLGTVYAPDDIASERYVALLGQSLVDGGFFRSSPEPIVGVIRQDTPEFERLTREVLAPILARAGLTIGHQESYNPNDTSNPNATTGAVFRLRGQGVTHVITYEQPLLYMIAAEGQAYRPAWSVSSRSGPGVLLETAAPREQLRGSMGPGWQPLGDLAAARLTGPVSPEETRCVQIMQEAEVYPNDQIARAIAHMLCGEVFHFDRVLTRAGELSSAGFRASAETLTGHVSPLTFAVAYTGGRHDGASEYRLNAYREDCSCYQYASPRQPIPAS